MLSKMYRSSHSWRTVRLYHSIYAFCWGFPGEIWFRAMPCFSAKIIRVELMYSGPLPKRIDFDLPAIR